MKYAIYSNVLMSCGVPENTWEVPSGQKVPWVVLSVRGCLLWVISNWGHFMGLCVYCFEQGCYDLGWGYYGIYRPILSVAQNSSKYEKVCLFATKDVFFWNSSRNPKLILV